ncbi:hypothetical protein LTR12_016718, partial [Friedmanniomyces endolithicus]
CKCALEFCFHERRRSTAHIARCGKEEVRPPSPLAYGHEGAGVVEEIGGAVKYFAVGDHVILTFNSRGHCTPCLRNQTSYCKHDYNLTLKGRRLDGTKNLFFAGVPLESTYFGQYSFAHRSTVGAFSAVKVDKSLPLDTLCSLACRIQTGAGTILTILNPRLGSLVAVYGVGGAVGLAAIAIAAHCTPAIKIIAVDVDDSRLEMARAFGATHTIKFKGKYMVELVQEVTDGEGVDYSLMLQASYPLLKAWFPLPRRTPFARL